MTNQPGNTITNRIIVDTASAIQEYQKIRAEIDATKKDLLAMQQAAGGGAFKDLGKGLATSLKAGTGDIQQIKSQVASITPAVQELNREGDKGVSTWQRFGRAISIALGITLYQIIRSIVSGIRELINTAIDYGRVLANLAVSTRALQSLGHDITFKDVIQQVRELKAQFPIVSTKDAADAVAYTQLLLRNFGATQEQMKKVTEIGAGLSLMLGKDLKTSVRELALFFSSGYAESLQRAGFAVNRLAVTEEAHRIGINKSYMQLKESERFQAAYNLILRQYANIQGDVNNLLDADYIKVQKVTTAWQDLKNTLSLQFLSIIAKVADGISTIIVLFNKAAIFGLGAFQLYQKIMQLSFANPFQYKKQLEEFVNWFPTWKQGITDLLSGVSDFSKMPFGNAALGTMTEDMQSEMEKQQDMAQRIYEEISQMDDQFKNEMINREIDYQNDLNKIRLDAERKQEQTAVDHQRKLDEIGVGREQKLLEALIKYEQDVADENAKIAQDEEDYRQKELDREEEFQNRMLKLREDFMLDLEDAVRDRDARQIMRLSRQYNLRVQQETRDFRLQQAQEEEQHQTEMRNRLAQLALEYQRRQEEINRQNQWEIDAENLKYQQELDDQALALQQRLDDRRNQWENVEIPQMQREFDQRFQMFVDDLARTNTLTATQLDAIALLYEGTYGKDGRVQKAIENALMWTALMSSVNGGMIGTGGPGTTYVGQGTYIPTMPSTSPNSTPAPNTNPSGIFNNPWSVSTSPNSTPVPQNITITLDVSPDLEVRVVDNALTQVANVFVNVQQRNKR